MALRDRKMPHSSDPERTQLCEASIQVVGEVYCLLRRWQGDMTVVVLLNEHFSSSGRVQKEARFL
jgi:hypothetical protein